jgi:amidase
VPDYLAGIARGLRGVWIGIAPAWTEAGADPTTQRAIASAVEVVRGLGAEVSEIRFPDVSQMIKDWFPLCGVETAVAHEATYPARKDEYGPALSGVIELGRALSGMDYQKIILRRNDFRGRVAALFRAIDLLLLPAQGFASPTLAKMATLGEDAALMTSLLGFTCPFDMSGSPTITLPCGFTETGTPVGFQFVGAHLAEELLCQAGYAFQQATDWHKRHPALG